MDNIIKPTAKTLLSTPTKLPVISCEFVRRFGALALACFAVWTDSAAPQTVPPKSAPVFQEERVDYVSTWLHPPAWSGNGLLNVDDNLKSSPIITNTHRDGTRESVAFEIAGAGLIVIRGVAGGPDGSIVVGGNAFSGDSRRAGFIAWISPDRKRRTLIQTEPFRPEAVTVAADGTVWGGGLIFDGEEGRHNDHGIIQRFDRSGKLLSSHQIPQALAWTNVPFDPDGTSHLMASKDRVSWLTTGCQLIEFGLNGDEIDRFDPPSGMDGNTLGGVALGEDDLVVMGKRVGRGTEVLWLDRESKSWRPLDIPGHDSSGHLEIFGADGNNLVVARAMGKISTIKLSQLPGR